jgi:hypothetical protein
VFFEHVLLVGKMTVLSSVRNLQVRSAEMIVAKDGMAVGAEVRLENAGVGVAKGVQLSI